MKTHRTLIAAILIYFIALWLPALHGGGTYLAGLALLMFGWVQTSHWECMAWLANPAFFGALLAYFGRLYFASACLAAAACLVGLDTFRATVFSPDERGTNVAIDHVGSAFYVWEMSFLIILVAGLVQVWKRHRLKASKHLPDGPRNR